MCYNHLTIDKRSQISALLSSNHLQKEIATILEVSPSTVCREIKRNSSLRGYKYKKANELAIERKKAANTRKRKWNFKLERLVKKLLSKKMSPEQISDRLKKTHNIAISHQRIYQYIWEDRENNGLVYTQLKPKENHIEESQLKKMLVEAVFLIELIYLSVLVS